jgi:RNA polymerase sigma-70 factor (ECF subfamily)
MVSREQAPEMRASGRGDRLSPIGENLVRARRGEAEGLSALYHHFLPLIFGYIASRVPDRATAEDLTSEVFLHMVEGIGRVRTSEEAGFAAWLLQIARTTVAAYYRKRERQPVFVSLDPVETDEGDHVLASTDAAASDPAYSSEAREEWHTVVKAINMLTEDQRQVLVGRLLLGYDVATMAQMIGKKANAVKALQFRALHSLHRLLGKRPLPKQAAYSSAHYQEEPL